MTVSRTFAAFACFGLLLSQTACSENNLKQNGPLVAGGDASEVCMVQPARGAAATGGVVSNEGNGPAILEDIALVEANDLKLLGRYIFPMDGKDDFVLGAGSTEPDDPQQNAIWTTAQRPGAYQLPSGATASLVVAVDNTTAGHGTAEAIRVTYSVDGKQYTVDTTTTIELAETSCF